MEIFYPDSYREWQKIFAILIKKQFEEIRAIRGGKSYAAIKQINYNNIFLEIQFVFLKDIKTHT